MTFELLVFTVISVVIIAALAVVILLVGVPFGMSPSAAIPVAACIFVVLMPGGMNLWIAATGWGGEDSTERIVAGIRGVAMICGWTCVIFLFAPRNTTSPYLPYIVATCFILFVWSVWRDGRHRTTKLKEERLIRYDLHIGTPK